MLNNFFFRILDAQNNLEAMAVESRRLQLSISEVEATNQVSLFSLI